MVLVFYEYWQQQTPGTDSLDTKDLIEEIIAIQTAKSSTPANRGDSAMDPESLRTRYETWGAYTCVKCAWRAITYARLVRRLGLDAEEPFGNQPCQPPTHHSQTRATP